MRRTADLSFTWELSLATMQRFADMVDGVATSIRPTHNYLETNGSDEVIVVVSKDEYPVEMFREQSAL
jgi:hypothetical protein